MIVGLLAPPLTRERTGKSITRVRRTKGVVDPASGRTTRKSSWPEQRVSEPFVHESGMKRA
jgi:hypothetical protein